MATLSLSPSPSSVPPKNSSVSANPSAVANTDSSVSANPSAVVNTDPSAVATAAATATVISSAAVNPADSAPSSAVNPSSMANPNPSAVATAISSAAPASTSNPTDSAFSSDNSDSERIVRRGRLKRKAHNVVPDDDLDDDVVTVRTAKRCAYCNVNRNKCLEECPFISFLEDNYQNRKSVKKLVEYISPVVLLRKFEKVMEDEKKVREGPKLNREKLFKTYYRFFIDTESDDEGPYAEVKDLQDRVDKTRAWLLRAINSEGTQLSFLDCLNVLEGLAGVTSN